MNTQSTDQTTPVSQKLTSYQNKLRLNRKYYHRKYENDPQFRQAEIDRNSERVLKKYHEDPEYRERVKQQALARYYRLKAQNAN
jgi:hypothetical protein